MRVMMTLIALHLWLVLSPLPIVPIRNLLIIRAKRQMLVIVSMFKMSMVETVL